MKRTLGSVLLLMGVGLGCWIVYRMMAERQGASAGFSPGTALLFAAGLLLVGGKWVRQS